MYAHNALLVSVRTSQSPTKFAAVFFLLIGAKETDKAMEGFIREQILYSESVDRHWDAIRKFKVLWDSRYHVWPRMEERAQKMFNANNETEDKKKEVYEN